MVHNNYKEFLFFGVVGWLTCPSQIMLIRFKSVTWGPWRVSLNTPDESCTRRAIGRGSTKKTQA